MKFTRASWKTASAGVLSISVAVLGFTAAWLNTGQYPGELALVAALTAILNGIGNIVARDDDKTSKEVGADIWAAERDKADTKEVLESLTK